VTSAPDLGRRGKFAVALSLTVVGGFVDAIGYIALYQVFTANMSGNSVHVGIYLGEHDWTNLSRPLCAIVSYLGAMAITRIAIGVAGRVGLRRIASFTLAAEAVLLAFFAHATPATHLGQISDQHSPAYFVLVALLACAMGIQTATLTHIGALTIYTTFVTGALTKMTESFTRALFWAYDLRRNGMPHIVGHASGQKDVQEGAMLLCNWMCYLLGAAVGTFLKLRWELKALYIPMAVLLVFVTIDLFRPIDVEEEKHQTGIISA
jgi:uncharacterized membrane protein YoaK (UPF0700 family)